MKIKFLILILILMCGNQRTLVEEADQGVLKWFGHVERMEAKNHKKDMLIQSRK